jgi:hypothetical protein
MRYSHGFVNRRSRVQISKAAPRKTKVQNRLSLPPAWPDVAYAPGHAQVRGSSSPNCTVLHSGPRFVQTECGRPATWLTPSWRVCEGCRREFLPHAPASLFREVAS